MSGEPTRDEVDDFIRTNDVDDRAANDLRDCPADIQARVLGRGDLSTARNPSAALLARIRDARTSVTGSFGSGARGDADVEEFIKVNDVDESAAGSLRSSSPGVQRTVLSRGDLKSARNPSSALLARIRDAKAGIGGGGGSMGGSGGSAGGSMGGYGMGAMSPYGGGYPASAMGAYGSCQGGVYPGGAYAGYPGGYPGFPCYPGYHPPQGYGGYPPQQGYGAYAGYPQQGVAQGGYPQPAALTNGAETGRGRERSRSGSGSRSSSSSYSRSRSRAKNRGRRR